MGSWGGKTAPARLSDGIRSTGEKGMSAAAGGAPRVSRLSHCYASIAPLYGEGYPLRGLKNRPFVVGVGCNCREIHLIGVVEIPSVHGLLFVGVGAQNNPILFSDADRDTGTVGFHYQRVTVAKARQARGVPRLQHLSGHSVVVIVEADDHAIYSLLGPAGSDHNSGDCVIGGRNERACHPLFSSTRIRAHDVV